MGRSKDAVVNFWNLPDPSAPESEFMVWNGHPTTIDNHVDGIPGDMTALTWNAEGTLLAIGSYDTVLRMITSDGDPYFIHHQHRVRLIGNLLATDSQRPLRDPSFPCDSLPTEDGFCLPVWIQLYVFLMSRRNDLSGSIGVIRVYLPDGLLRA